MHYEYFACNELRNEACNATVYAGQCLSKGRRVTLTIESVTAMRNLHAAPADEGTQPGTAAHLYTSTSTVSHTCLLSAFDNF